MGTKAGSSSRRPAIGIPASGSIWRRLILAACPYDKGHTFAPLALAYLRYRLYMGTGMNQDLV